jgi:hypothetical protein
MLLAYLMPKPAESFRSQSFAGFSPRVSKMLFSRESDNIFVIIGGFLFFKNGGVKRAGGSLWK